MIDDKKKEKLAQLERNFNNEFMTDLWNKYHFSTSKKFKLLYYDPK